jgi:hypothetical protein
MTAKSVEARRNGPPFTAVSNAFIDWLMADCTGSEVQVFLYLSRRTRLFSIAERDWV